MLGVGRLDRHMLFRVVIGVGCRLHFQGQRKFSVSREELIEHRVVVVCVCGPFLGLIVWSTAR